MNARDTGPVLLFDGDCGFCRRSAARLDHHVRGAVRVVPYQEVDLAALHPELRVEDCEVAVQLIEADGRWTQGAEACFRAMSYAPGLSFLRGIVRVPLVRPVTEAIYRAIARNRGRTSRLIRLVSGPDPAPGTYLLARRLCFVLLGLALVLTLLGFALDATRLCGAAGIVPFEHAIAWDQHTQPAGFLAMPSFLWFWRSDTAIHVMLGLGLLGTAFVLCQRFLRTGLALALLVWLGLLSTALPPGASSVPDPFVGFVADALLVELGVVALLLAPRRHGFACRVPGLALFLVRLLLVRVVFFDALGHHAAGGAWSGLDAFTAHLASQPCPTRLALIVAEGPAPIREALRLGMLAASLFGVFCVFGPRRLRAIAFGSLFAHACWLAALENRGPWSLLVLAMAVFALDDQTLARLRRVAPTPEDPLPQVSRVRAVSMLSMLLLAALVTFPRLDLFGARELITPWFVCNDYTGQGRPLAFHPGLIVEGSDDGAQFERIAPRHAPSRLEDAPAWLTPALPRFDMGLEFAARDLALGSDMPGWMLSAIAALLERRGDTRALWAAGPFEDRAPRFVRVRLRPLRPADPVERGSSGLWWYNDADVFTPRVFSLDSNGALVELPR